MLRICSAATAITRAVPRTAHLSAEVFPYKPMAAVAAAASLIATKFRPVTAAAQGLQQLGGPSSGLVQGGRCQVTCSNISSCSRYSTSRSHCHKSGHRSAFHCFKGGLSSAQPDQPVLSSSKSANGHSHRLAAGCPTGPLRLNQSSAGSSSDAGKLCSKDSPSINSRSSSSGAGGTQGTASTAEQLRLQGVLPSQDAQQEPMVRRRPRPRQHSPDLVVDVTAAKDSSCSAATVINSNSTSGSSRFKGSTSSSTIDAGSYNSVAALSEQVLQHGPLQPVQGTNPPQSSPHITPQSAIRPNRPTRKRRNGLLQPSTSRLLYNSNLLLQCNNNKSCILLPSSGRASDSSSAHEGSIDGSSCSPESNDDGQGCRSSCLPGGSNITSNSKDSSSNPNRHTLQAMMAVFAKHYNGSFTRKQHAADAVTVTISQRWLMTPSSLVQEQEPAGFASVLLSPGSPAAAVRIGELLLALPDIPEAVDELTEDGLPVGSRVTEQEFHLTQNGRPYSFVGNVILCGCGQPVYISQSVQSKGTRGRRFVRCRNFDWKARRCFFMWLSQVPAQHIDAVLNSNSLSAPEPGYHGVSQLTSRPVTSLEGKSMWLLGAWAEAFLFQWLRRVLPGFTAHCWTSHNRRILGHHIEPRVPDTPFDFQYEAPEILPTACLGIKAGCRYRIDCKACRGSAIFGAGKGVREVWLSPREWHCARDMHTARGEQGIYVIIVIERVSPQFVPTPVAVLEDPYGMMLEGRLWVQPVYADDDSEQVGNTTSIIGYKLVRYPVLPGSLCRHQP